MARATCHLEIWSGVEWVVAAEVRVADDAAGVRSEKSHDNPGATDQTRSERAKGDAMKKKNEKKTAKRKQIRDDLFARVPSTDLSIIDAVKMMRKVTAKSQADYAKLVGISPRILIELERGIGNPTMKTLNKMLAPFGLELGVVQRKKSGAS